MSGIEAKHRYSGCVSNIDQLLAAIESDLRRSIVSADAEIPFVTLCAKIEHREPRVELEDLPALAVDYCYRPRERLGHLSYLLSSKIARKAT
jgi:hypothetical protein